MSLNDLRKLRTSLNVPNANTEDATVEIGAKKCPACNRVFPKSYLVVCQHDGTLLIPTKRFELFIEGKINAGIAHNRYKIEEWIGEGDLTNVFYAQDKESNKRVVLKVIKSQLLVEPRRIRKFADTLQETIALRHPNIVSVLDSGIGKASERGIPQVFFVVEKLTASKNLKAILHQHGPIAPYVVIEAMIKTCETLDDAAKMGWLHHDIKPSNIYISINEEHVSVKISDFGVAARMFPLLEWESKGTKTSSIYGNAAYISPDKSFGQELSLASDVYSLGCTMYHVLKGMPPFEGNNDFCTIMEHLHKLPKPFANELKIPKDLESIVMKCLQKKPEDRYQSFKELAVDLNGIKSTS